MSSKMVHSSFKNWKIPHMIDEVEALEMEYMFVRNDEHIEDYRKTYTKIIEICDKTSLEIYDKYKCSYMIKDYLHAKKESNSEDTTRNTRVDYWISKSKCLVYALLNIYARMTDFMRFCRFKEKTKFTEVEAESVVFYITEKLGIRIKNTARNLDELSSFKKDTLLAMKCINRYASENSISKDDTIELFREYIGKPFFSQRDIVYDEDENMMY